MTKEELIMKIEKISSKMRYNCGRVDHEDLNDILEYLDLPTRVNPHTQLSELVHILAGISLKIQQLILTGDLKYTDNKTEEEVGMNKAQELKELSNRAKVTLKEKHIEDVYNSLKESATQGLDSRLVNTQFRAELEAKLLSDGFKVDYLGCALIGYIGECDQLQISW